MELPVQNCLVGEQSLDAGRIKVLEVLKDPSKKTVKYKNCTAHWCIVDNSPAEYGEMYKTNKWKEYNVPEGANNICYVPAGFLEKNVKGNKKNNAVLLIRCPVYSVSR